jgi:hypothetical protein
MEDGGYAIDGIDLLMLDGHCTIVRVRTVTSDSFSVFWSCSCLLRKKQDGNTVGEDIVLLPLCLSLPQPAVIPDLIHRLSAV